MLHLSDIIIFLILIGCLSSYIPVFMALFFTSIAGFALFTEMPLMITFQTLLKSLDNFALVVVLFFILCGNIMTKGSIVKKLIDIANAMVSFLPGGLGMAGILACAMFGAISGSTVATVVAIGGFMIPALREHGYPDSYTTGLMASAPNLGVIIPPSIGMILYSMITNVSLEGLFLSGFVPGLLIVVFFCVYTVFYFRKDTLITRNPPPNFNSVFKAFKNGFFAIMLPVLIFGGIFSGVFTANEAAVVACVYAFIVEIFIHRTMKLKDMYYVTINSAVTSATLLMIVAGATCFGRFITLENIPGRLTDFVMGSIDSSFSFLLVMNIFLLVVGMFMDIISAVLIIGPVIVPMLYSFNIDPLHFGLIMTVNLAIGYCTPPMGVSLFITDTIAGNGIVKISKSVFPFLIIQIFVLMLITYFPDMVLYLPKVFGFIK